MTQIISVSSLLCLLLLYGSQANAHWVYVSNEKDNTISVIDTTSNEVIRTIEVGERPRGVTLSRDYKHLYICASDSDAVQVMDVATDKILHDLPSGADPEQFALHPDNRHLYIANEDDAIATVVPRDAEFTRDDTELWVSSEIGGTVAIMDVATKTIKQTLSFEIQGIVPERIQPVGMELTSDGKYAFIALGPSNHVAVVDRETLEVIKYILVGRRVWHMTLTPDEDYLYTTNGVSGDVTVIDVASLKATKSIKVGRFPWGAALLPDEHIPAQ